MRLACTDHDSHGLAEDILTTRKFWYTASILNTMAALNVILGGIMFLLVVLYNLSSAARYHMKFVFFIFISLVSTTIFIPFMLIKPRDPRNALMPAFVLRRVAWMLGISWEVRGLQNIDNARGAVVLINHQTSLDLLILAILWPLMHRSTVVSKREILYLFPFGFGAWLWGTVFINRSSTDNARASVNQQAEAVRDKKAKLLLFPEGTRHMGPDLLPFRKGAFHAALAARSPVQPVVVSNFYFLDCKRKIFDSGHLIVSILPQIDTDGMSKDDLPMLLEKTQNVMQREYTATTAEVLARLGSDAGHGRPGDEGKVH